MFAQGQKLGMQKSAECELQPGKASSGGTIFRDGEEVQLNPRAFSANADALEWAKSGKLAEIQYDDNATSLFSTRETQYVIWRVSRSEPIGWPDDDCNR